MVIVTAVLQTIEFILFLWKKEKDEKNKPENQDGDALDLINVWDILWMSEKHLINVWDIDVVVWDLLNLN